MPSGSASFPLHLLQLFDELSGHVDTLDLDEHGRWTLNALDGRVGHTHEVHVVLHLLEGHLVRDEDVEEDIAQVGLRADDHLGLATVHRLEVEHAQALLLELAVLLEEELAS